VTPKSRDTSRGGACQIPREERERERKRESGIEGRCGKFVNSLILSKMWNRWLCGFETVSKRYLFSSKRFVCDRE